MSIYYTAAVEALGPIADDPRAAKHIHDDWIDFGRISDVPTWSSGELAAVTFARNLYSADGFVGLLGAVDGDQRRRMLGALDTLLGGLVS